MSLIKLTSDNFDYLTLELHPARSFSSSSDGVTGSVKLYGNPSDIEKEVTRLSAFTDTQFNEESIEDVRNAMVLTASNSTNIHGAVEQYLTKVNSEAASARKATELNIVRYTPSVSFSENTLRKNTIKNVLMPWYASSNHDMEWTYTNYNTLNFHTASNVSDSAVMIYPAATASTLSTAKWDDTTKGPYQIDGPFTFDFYINPRYTSDDVSGYFSAGTIMHMSSSFAVSLVSGSSRDVNDRPDGYRIMLQLSHSAEISPKSVVLTSSANTVNDGAGIHDLIFLSDDNSLSKNTWHHVAIKWGSGYNSGTGSFIVDNQECGTFEISQNTIIPRMVATTNQHTPDAIFLGNFFDGANSSASGQLVAEFFNSTVADAEGLVDLFGGTHTDEPATFAFECPLNAEVHDIKIYNEYRTQDQTMTSSIYGVDKNDSGSLLFYVPPFFTRESRPRDVLQTPFQSIRTKTDDPFNVAMSFGVGGLQLNLENFTREFVQGDYPRLYKMFSSASLTTASLSANDILHLDHTHVKRNLMILPSDNGKFKPNFSLLASGSSTNCTKSGSLCEKYSNAYSAYDLSKINLDNLVTTSSLQKGLFNYDIESYADITGSTSIANTVAGATPEDPGIAPGSILTIYQRTRDESSNEVIMFDISNLFYGDRIQPGTLTITDTDVSGSTGKVSLTLKDDGHGSLHRANSVGPWPTWASVGNVIYNEGIILLKSPHLQFFGKHQYDISFKGHRNVHVFEVRAPVPMGMLNSSSNPTYKPLLPSDYASETDNDFVYISDVNFHDENLNVVAKTSLAQPLIKRDGDEYIIRVKLDY
jgi:hypothetical protein